MRLLIVEDENRTRELLHNFIPWEEIGIDDVLTARNGMDALDKVEECQPDIVLCDVRMPKLNGIEFAKQYRNINSDFKLIFLSGFSDKEYLKSAINLKALTYIEKPINLEEVRDAVKLAVQQCFEDNRKSKEVKKMHAEIDRSLPLLRQAMVRKLITAPNSPHVEPSLQRHETFLIPLTGPYSVLVASLYWNLNDHTEDPSLVQEWILNSINQDQELIEMKAIAGFDSTNRLVIIIPGAYRSSYREGRDKIEQLLKYLFRIMGNTIELKVGIGEPAKQRLGIPEAYRLASLASSLQYYHNGRYPIFSEMLGGHSPLQINWEEVKRMQDQLRRGQFEEAKDTLRKWTAYVRINLDLDLMRVKNTYFQFLYVIMEIAVQIGIAELSDDTEKRYLWKEIDRISSLDATEQYVLTFLELLDDRPRASNPPGSSKIREIIHYINNNFHKKGFTINSIADHVQLTETYLCAFFKKHKGQTIKEFIIFTKMNRAKELLRDSNIKLFEIALNLGFNDANYFTTFFKRYEGCTPSEYRERVMK